MRIVVGRSALALLVVVGASATAATTVAPDHARKIRDIRQSIGLERKAFKDSAHVLTLLLDAQTSRPGELLTADTPYLCPCEKAGAAAAPDRRDAQGITPGALYVDKNPQTRVSAPPRSSSPWLQIARRADAFGHQEPVRWHASMDIHLASLLRELTGIESRSDDSFLIPICGGCGVLLTLVWASIRLNRLIAQMRERQAQYEQLVRQLQTIREDERAHLARELHDELGQKLTELKFDLIDVGRCLGRGAVDEAHEHALRATAAADASLQQMRSVAMSLRPPLLDQAGLAAALQALGTEFRKRNSLLVELTVPHVDPSLNDLEKITFFRIAQEALTNVTRHANASAVAIRLVADDHRLQLTIVDDGRGFDPMQETKSLGVIGMKERAMMIGADLSLKTHPAGGTLVCLSLPISDSAERPS